MIDLTQYRRRATHEVRIGACTIGGTHPVAVQSMTNTDTRDIAACVAQIERIARAGAPIVRLTAQGVREAENLRDITERLRADGNTTALVADIHFLPEAAAVAAQYVDKVRINPGNYRLDRGELEALVARCRERGVALRIGVNHGSLSKRIFDEWGDTPEGMVAAAMEFLHVCRREAFDQVVVSMKSSNTRVMVAAYRLLVEAMEREGMTYPIHLGVTEAGTYQMGLLKSGMGIGGMLLEGIGDTIRVSLAAEPEKEVEAGYNILRAVGFPVAGPEVITCPTCGRTQYPCTEIANEVEKRLQGCKKSIKVAVMGCVVNGPGEAREADIGIAGGKGEAVLFIHGKPIKKLTGDNILDQFMDEIYKL